MDTSHVIAEGMCVNCETHIVRIDQLPLFDPNTWVHASDGHIACSQVKLTSDPTNVATFDPQFEADMTRATEEYRKAVSSYDPDQDPTGGW